MRFDCLILAAGASSRFGGCKLLAQWRGEALVDASITAALAVGPASVNVVTGAHHRALHAHLQTQGYLAAASPPVRLIRYHGWHLGMGHSLAYGIGKLPKDHAVLVMLGDQPLVDADDLNNLLSAWRHNSEQIVCAVYGEKPGVPALFPAREKPQLSRLKGDKGAKKLLEHAAATVRKVVMANAAFDIDTPTELARLARLETRIEKRMETRTLS